MTGWKDAKTGEAGQSVAAAGFLVDADTGRVFISRPTSRDQSATYLRPGEPMTLAPPGFCNRGGEVRYESIGGL